MIDRTTEIESRELLGSFQRPLFFPRYRPGAVGSWTLSVVPMLAARGGGRAPRLADPAVIAREIEAIDRLGARHVFLDDPDYPPLLAELESAPPVLRDWTSLSSPNPGRRRLSLSR